MNHRALSLLVVAGSLASLVACAPTKRDDASESVRAAAAIEAPRRRLEALAELETLSPARGDLAARARVIDPSLPQALAPSSGEYRRATRPLDTVLGDLPVPTPASGPAQTDAESKRRAVKLYAQARDARLGGDAGKALELADAALELDPDSPKLWRELGESRLEQNDRPGAVEALTTAAELGERDPRVLLVVASDAASRQDADTVIRFAGECVRQTDGVPSPEGVMARAMLGTALLERGDLLAGAGVLDDAVSTLDAIAPEPGESGDITRLRTRRAELAFRVGDTWATLGDAPRAARAYARAGGDEGRPPVPVTQRMVASLVASGRPASAALEMLDHVEAWKGDLGAEETQWLRGLSGVDRVGPALVQALDAVAADPSNVPSVRRQTLRTIVRGCEDASVARAALARSGAAARDPVIAGEMLVRIEPAQRVRAATDGVRADPASVFAWSEALARLDPTPMGTAHTLLAARDAASRTLGAGVASTIQRPDLVPQGFDWSGVDPFVRADVLAIGGRWDAVDDALDAARAAATADPGRRADLLRALVGGQRLDGARSLAEGIDADPDATVEDLLAASEAALALGSPQDSIDRLDRAARIDPYEESVWERRVALRTGDSPVASEDDARRLGRELAERRPRSGLFALLRAREMGGQGMLREACETIVGVGRREPARDMGVQLLAQAAAAAKGKGDTETPKRVLAWLQGRLTEAPGSVPLTLAVAQLQLDTPEEALKLLDDAYARIGQVELARNAEIVLAQRLDRADEARERGLARLPLPLGVDSALERAEIAASAGKLPEAIQAARAALPRGGTLTDGQRRRWAQVAFALVRADDNGLAGPVVALLDDAERAGVGLPEEAQRARTLLLARAGDTDRLRSMIDAKALGEDTALVVVQALLSTDHKGDGIDLLGELATENGKINTDLLSEWARLVGSGGDADRVRALLARLDTTGLTAEAASALRTQFATSAVPGEAPGRDAADIAYAAALVATVVGREDEALDLYRLVLEHDPDHAWACNDLGYALADRAGNAEEGEALVERAYRQLPDEASVLDSLGWARFRLGVYSDETDASGAVVREGAVTLLERAAATEDGKENATIQIHLGQALWAQGRSDDAVKAWTEGERLLRQSQRQLAGSNRPNQRQQDRVNEQLREVRRLIGAAEEKQGK